MKVAFLHCREIQKIQLLMVLNCTKQICASTGGLSCFIHLEARLKVIKKGQKCIWHLWHKHTQIFILGEGGPSGNGIYEVPFLFKTLLGDVIALPPSNRPITRLLMAVTLLGKWMKLDDGDKLLAMLAAEGVRTGQLSAWSDAEQVHSHLCSVMGSALYQT